jgi:hypothetical protein
MGTGDARSAGPQDTRQAVPSTGKGPRLIGDLGRWTGGSAVDGPLGLLAAVEGDAWPLTVTSRPLRTQRHERGRL